MSSPTTAPVFDAAKYKATTRDQWDRAAEPWHRWAPTLADWLGPATETMLDMMALRQGDHVLDVAAGAGEQSIRAARRVGPTGEVLATDISPRILEFAATAAKEAGVGNIQTRVLDGENLDLPANSYHAAMSRVGLIFFPDRHKALQGILRVLKPGGRFGTIVYSSAENNGFFSSPIGIIRRRAGLTAPAPGQPGPFSLADPRVLRSEFETAGFRNVELRTVPAPLRLPSVKECLRFQQESFGALHQMLSGLNEEGKRAAWDEVETALRAFETPAGFQGPCELVLATGTK